MNTQRIYEDWMKKNENSNELYNGNPVCLARYYNSYCGKDGDWLCEKHIEDYEKNKKMRNGWYDCYGPDLCCDVSGFGKIHEEWTKGKEYYNRENADLRNEECKRMYPLE